MTLFCNLAEDPNKIIFSFGHQKPFRFESLLLEAIIKIQFLRDGR